MPIDFYVAVDKNKMVLGKDELGFCWQHLVNPSALRNSLYFSSEEEASDFCVENNIVANEMVMLKIELTA